VEINEYTKYKDDPVWMKSKYDGVSGEQRLPVQRRLRKGGDKFKKGDEILFFPKGKVIMVGKEAEQAWRDFQAAAQDEDFYMSQYEESKMEKQIQERYDSTEYKKAIKFMSGLHSSILKTKDKVIRWLERKGFKSIAGDVDDMSPTEWSSFLSNKVMEQKLRNKIRTILNEIINK
jgi:hypothetical protein